MELTFKEFCDKIGYGKHDHIKSLSALAGEIGVSISYISKMYNSMFMGRHTGKAYSKVKTYVNSKGYELITSNPLENIIIKEKNENVKLKQIISDLVKENSLLREQLVNLKYFRSVATLIASNENKIPKFRKKETKYGSNDKL